MIIVKQDENFRTMGFGSLKFCGETNEFQLPVFTFTMVKLADGTYACPNIYPEYKLVATYLITDRQFIDPVTKIMSSNPSGEPAYTYFKSRTVGDIYSDEQIEAMSTAEVRAIKRYDMDAQDVEEFILANGYVTGVRI